MNLNNKMPAATLSHFGDFCAHARPKDEARRIRNNLLRINAEPYLICDL